MHATTCARRPPPLVIRRGLVRKMDAVVVGPLLGTAGLQWQERWIILGQSSTDHEQYGCS